ncbi:hypothetical protein BH09MYX1_BH09MYX1_41160 [soil metagenome]
MRGASSILSPLVLASAILFASRAEGETNKLNLGEVSAAPKADQSAVPLLRTTTEAELQSLDLRGAKKDAILSISLVRLETDGERVTCVVSATLRTRSGGTIFAILEGRALAVGVSGSAKSASLKGAVHGALGRIPEALK